ncbi:MAG: outer membrane protein assembly factor BamA, partial [Daejeonella sp.]|nr:outer membrane protein assembly factor BamA [Daejeonella sp.]
LQSNEGIYSNQNLTDDQIQRFRMNGLTFTLGQRLKWPDDYFQTNTSINLQQYVLKNYGAYFSFPTGTAYNFNISEQFSRNSIEGTVYPVGGSHIRLTVQATPPYSLFNNVNYKTATSEVKNRFTEYYKAKFESQWYQRIYGKLVLKAQAQFGFLGSYNATVGQSAFERFKLGGDGMMGFDYLQGSEVIAMRGYANNAIVPLEGPSNNIAQNSGSPIFNKYVLEVRHPISLAASAQIYVLAFAEGGNTWSSFKQFNPFNVRRVAGVGARVYLPIFGLLGIDYGKAFDRIPGAQDGGKQAFTFSIAQSLSGGF